MYRMKRLRRTRKQQGQHPNYHTYLGGDADSMTIHAPLTEPGPSASGINEVVQKANGGVRCVRPSVNSLGNGVSSEGSPLGFGYRLFLLPYVGRCLGSLQWVNARA